MFPTFFHFDSHVWIFYSLILNGLLLDYLFKCFSHDYKKLTSSFEATCLAAFFISLGINGLSLKLLDSLDFNFLLYSKLFPFLTLLFAVGVLLCIYRQNASPILFKTNWYRVSFYFLVFIVMFYNGGLIELVADSWWHMSFANKIAYFNSFSLENGHLDGITKRYYPPLWHANLALLKIQSSLSLPVIWNSFTAWGAVLKLMAFYLFAKQLTGNRNLAFISIVLFTILPGVHNSYFRLSAWPSQIAYTQLYVLFYLFFFALFDKPTRSEKFNFSVNSLWGYIKLEKVTIAMALYVVVLLTYTHLLEIVWFYLAILVSSAVWMFLGVGYDKTILDERLKKNRVILGVVSVSLLVVACFFIVFRFFDSWQFITSNIDLALAYICILAIICYSLWIGFALLNESTIGGGLSKKVFWALMLIIFSVAIDWRHVLALFIPSYEYSSVGKIHHPHSVTGIFDGALSLPSWKFQLREGLLYSGFISLFISIWLVIRRASFANFFLMANAVFAFLICISPYLYYLYGTSMEYSSVWRVTVLIFHPIIYAQFISEIVGIRPRLLR